MLIISNVIDRFTSLFNTLSFSGCTDVIVIRDNKNRLSCTKFYVSFEQNFYNSTVYLIVNGVVTDITMTIDEIGNCYFEIEDSKSMPSPSSDIYTYNTISLNELEKSIKFCTDTESVVSEKSANASIEDQHDSTKVTAETPNSCTLATKHDINSENNSEDSIISTSNASFISVGSDTSSPNTELKMDEYEKCVMTDSEDDLRLLKSKTPHLQFLTRNMKLNTSKVITGKFMKKDEIIRSTNLIFRTYAMRYFRKRETFYETGDDVMITFLKSKKHYDYLEESTERLFMMLMRRLGHAYDDNCIDYEAKNNVDGLYDTKHPISKYGNCSVNDGMKFDTGENNNLNLTKDTELHRSICVKCQCSGRMATYHSPYAINYENLKKKTVMHGDTFNFSITYSLCGDKKVNKSLEKMFSDHIVSEWVDSPNLVARISDGHISFYLPCDLFLSLFLYCINKKVTLCKFKEFMQSKMGRKSVYKKRTLVLGSESLHKLNLKYGKNTLEYKIAGVNKRIEVSVYLWNETDKIIVSDIDGTITKSDVLGHIYDLVGKDWTHCGVAALFTKIVGNNYKIIYLSNRAMSMYFRTKRYLSNVKQNEHTLPEGPILLAPNSILSTLYSEVRNKAHIFKIDCLKHIMMLFSNHKPFFAGFGNRISDLLSYKMIGIQKSMIFIIERNGIICENMEKRVSTSYLTLNHFATTLFPVIKKVSIYRDRLYNDTYYWKI